MVLSNEDNEETDWILDNFVEPTEYDRLDTHSKVMFLLWCPIVDFTVIIARYFKDKWKFY